MNRGRLKASLLAVVSLALSVALAEGILSVLRLPVEHAPAVRDPQFAPVAKADFIYANAPNAAIRFMYDSNPRGYFGPENEIVQHTNSHGFRGAPFAIHKPPETVRFLFLGDSFTFGEGVRDEDTFVARLEKLVASSGLYPGKNVELLNFGVGGFNTVQEAALLRQFGVVLSPDRIFIGYCLNDAEPLLFRRTPDGGLSRRGRGEAPENARTVLVPRPWNRFRLTRLSYLAWRRFGETRQTIAHYRSLYEEKNPDWARAREALAEIGRLCRERHIPATVVIFPVFFQLKDGYPFQDLHARVREAVTAAGMDCLDLYPLFRDFSGPELWVHPSDQHPNEIAHRKIADFLLDSLERTQNR